MQIVNSEKLHAIELLKCRLNPLYFIYNYVYIPEVGGKRLYGDVFHPKLARVVRSIYRHHKAVFLASRQLGKSTISAAIILWAILFFPKMRAVILNFRKDAGYENIDKIKFMWENLPDWMRIPSPMRSISRKTYFELETGSRVTVMYPSTVHKPDTVARSLTVPILYIDEAAYIPHLHEIYGAAQQILATARQQAKRNNYPYFQLVTSTPNGVYAPEGNDKPNWFYERWSDSIDSDMLFVKDKNGHEKWIDDEKLRQLLDDPSKNGFIGIRYHWSEDPNKDEKWYMEQCRELKSQRLINQELDLLFVGSTQCIFSDETLSQLKATTPVEKVSMPHGTTLKLFTTEFDPNDYYLIGVDTASSTAGAYNAIQVFSYKDFNQVAELQSKLGSLTYHAQVVDAVFRYIKQRANTNRIILAIENNSIGKAVIEYLTMQVSDINYANYIWKSKKNEFGIRTGGDTKPLMVALLKEKVEQYPENFHSQLLISQFATVETSNRGTITVKGYSDLFMAASFCAYVRQKTLMEILPLIEKSNDKLEKEFFNTVKELATAVKPSTQSGALKQQTDEQLTPEQRKEIELLTQIFDPTNSPIETTEFEDVDTYFGIF